MGGTGVIDRFLEVFTRYIDSGFGLLGGEVAFIATTLIVIDMTLAALFWSWGDDEDIIAGLVKKTLFVGVFAYLIGNWNALAKIVFESFAGLGLKASGTGFSTTDLLRPGRVAQVGLDTGRPILESISGLMGYIAFFENFIQIVEKSAPTGGWRTIPTYLLDGSYCPCQAAAMQVWRRLVPDLDPIETRATAHLTGFDVEFVHRRTVERNIEQISITVTAVPSFDAFREMIEAANPFMFWMRAAQLAWQPWIEAARILALPRSSANS